MRKQDHLIRLIHSLTPSEKKYFRQYVATRSDSKSYEKLFDVLHRSESYDAEAVSRSLGKSKKNLADDKEYLQDILLKSLQGYHASSMYRARCFNGLIEAEILTMRGMQELALSRIRRLKKTILPGEENLYYYMVLAQETNLMKMDSPGGLRADTAVKDNSDELVDRLQSILLHNQIVKIAIQVIDLCSDFTFLASPLCRKKLLHTYIRLRS